jgi:UDP-N-acetylmuramoyl-tripeptide--D-alanyl-D-alanine ligase
MDIFVPKFIKYQLYLLQLENYELGRYWKLLVKRGFFPSKKTPQRKELVWSAKAKALMLMAWALHGLVIILTGLAILSIKPGIDNFFSAVILAILIILPFYFILFSLALLILKPLDSIAKNRLAARAKSKIKLLTEPSPQPSPKGRGGLRIIGVAGSYGKTTMKEVLGQVLGARFKVLGTPESVNTPVGIARWILNKVTDETQIIIVEMGEHYKGDIKDICDIASPDIAVVTGINESHLERMKNMDTVAATVFEIVSHSERGALVMLNADDNRVMENYKKFVWPDHRVQEFRIKNLELRIFDVEKLVWKVKSSEFGEVEINLLGEYALGDVDAAVKIGRSLGMSGEEIKRGIANIKPVEHRLQPIKSAGDVLVIDDAYNGNPDGVAEAIKVLSRFTNRRKIYITPGLVEMGKSSADIHRAIGRQLAEVADVVILVKNSVTPWIEEGITTTPSRQGGTPLLFQEGTTAAAVSPPKVGGVPRVAGGGGIPKIIWFNSALKAHAGLKNILKPGDVILFQNDWGDQYV